jgi:hypothetical protein
MAAAGPFASLEALADAVMTVFRSEMEKRVETLFADFPIGLMRG